MNWRQQREIDSDMRSNLIYWLKVLGINVGLISLVAILVELVFGAWIKAPGLWTLGIRRDFAIHWWLQEKCLRDRPMVYSRDYYGFRGNSHALRNINIVAMGGSTTEEPNVSDNETWTANLEQCLVRRGVPAKIANAGINGQSTLGHIRNFDVWLHHLPNFRPSYLLAYVGINEPKIEGSPEDNRFQDDVIFRDRKGEPNNRYGAGTTERYTTGKVLLDWVTINSAFYSIYRIAWGNIQAIRLGSNPRWNTEFYYDVPKRGVLWRAEHSTFSELEHTLLKKRLADQAMRSMDRVEQTGKTGAMRINDKIKIYTNSVELRSDVVRQKIHEIINDNNSNLKNYKRRLKMLSNKATAFGATPIFITQPKGSYRIEGEKLRGSLGAYAKISSYNRTLMNFCAEEGFKCVDLGSNLEFKDSDFWDSEHTTPRGSARIGNHICKALIAGNLVERISD